MSERGSAGRPTEESVGKVQDVPPGSCKVVDVGGREIVIFNVDGDFFAMRDRCPHQGAPLSGGMITGAMLPCKPGELNYGMEGMVVECPWHRWKFSVETGESLFGVDRRKVPVFPVRIEGENLILELRRAARSGQSLGSDDSAEARAGESGR